MAVVPFGGGTSVTGGLVAARDGYAGVVSLDLIRMDQLLGVDPISMTARLQPGMRGPQAEAALAEHGLRLGHYPQSFEFASIGGFAATRSSGQNSAGFGRFDQMVVGLRVATPIGELVVGSSPANAAGPDLRQLVLGSEGTFGVITEITVRVRTIAAETAYEAWRFESFIDGQAAMRHLAQNQILPTIIRLSDEAETALSARHMLAYGLPLSTDGRTWIQQEEVPFHEFSSDYVWIYHPWMQYAATALSFAVLGESTSSARLPFALAGVACILLLYRLARRSQPDPGVARLAAILLALFVPTILLARQCRYYAISAALTLLVLDSYLSLGSARQWSVPCFVLSSVLLFHTEYAAFFPVMAAVAAHALLFQRHSGLWKNLLPALALIVLLILPLSLIHISEPTRPY